MNEYCQIAVDGIVDHSRSRSKKKHVSSDKYRPELTEIVVEKNKEEKQESSAPQNKHREESFTRPPVGKKRLQVDSSDSEADERTSMNEYCQIAVDGIVDHSRSRSKKKHVSSDKYRPKSTEIVMEENKEGKQEASVHKNKDREK